MPSPWLPVPWPVSYLARRTAAVAVRLAEEVGVTVFPSAPPLSALEGGWAAGYAAGTLDALEDTPLTVATR